jgi:hypothetical protein
MSDLLQRLIDRSKRPLSQVQPILPSMYETGPMPLEEGFAQSQATAPPKADVKQNERTEETLASKNATTTAAATAAAAGPRPQEISPREPLPSRERKRQEPGAPLESKEEESVIAMARGMPRARTEPPIQPAPALLSTVNRPESQTPEASSLPRFEPNVPLPNRRLLESPSSDSPWAGVSAPPEKHALDEVGTSGVRRPARQEPRNTSRISPPVKAEADAPAIEVNVSIGHIEVRAAPRDAAPISRKSPRPRVSLADFLGRRRQGDLP